mgnify:CR=1 FL=1
MKRLFQSHHHFFELARTGYRLPAFLPSKAITIFDYIYPILALLLSISFLIISQVIGTIFTALWFSPFASSETSNLGAFIPETAVELMASLIATFGPLFLILAIWLLLFEKRQLWTIGLERKQALYYYLRGLLVGVLMLASAVGISAAFGYIAFEEGNPQTQGIAALGGVGIIFLGWMVQGAAEELLTRGWLLQVIGSRYHPVIGIFLSSLLFALLHGLNPNVSAIGLLNIFLFGVFAALYTLYEGGLWGIFSIHSAWNWAQGNLFGFQVSGLEEVGNTAINLMEVGPDMITGGPFGPEGGLAATIVLLTSSVLVLIASQRQTSDRAAS